METEVHSMKREKPVDVVYNYIKKQIVTKAMYPGTRIVEEDIVRETGVSRTPVRTALMRLSYEGLVDLQPNRGAMVARPSEEELKQAYEVRAVLEMGAFRLALHRRTEEDLQMMAASLQKQEKLLENFTMTEYVALNREFHGVIAKAAKNTYYEKFLNELYNKVSTYLLFWDTSVSNSVSLEAHRRIYEALRDQDETKAIQSLLADIGQSEDVVCHQHFD